MMVMEAWTPRAYKETADYLRVSMHEKVTLYIHKRPSRNGQYYTSVYFYGPNHERRAEAYAALTGGMKPWPASNGTAHTVDVPR